MTYENLNPVDRLRRHRKAWLNSLRTDESSQPCYYAILRDIVTGSALVYSCDWSLGRLFVQARRYGYVVVSVIRLADGVILCQPKED